MMEGYGLMAEPSEPEVTGALLASHAFMDGMEPRHMQMLAEHARPVHIKEGHYIFREGEAADRMFLITRGCVSLEVYNMDYGPIQIQTVGRDEVLGWSWFVPPYMWRFDARAVQETDALVFDARILLTLCEEHTDLGFDVMKRMAAIVEQRLAAAKEHLQAVYGRAL